MLLMRYEDINTYTWAILLLDYYLTYFSSFLHYMSSFFTPHGFLRFSFHFLPFRLHFPDIYIWFFDYATMMPFFSHANIHYIEYGILAIFSLFSFISLLPFLHTYTLRWYYTDAMTDIPLYYRYLLPYIIMRAIEYDRIFTYLPPFSFLISSSCYVLIYSRYIHISLFTGFTILTYFSIYHAVAFSASFSSLPFISADRVFITHDILYHYLQDTLWWFDIRVSFTIRRCHYNEG